jgi:hypothetical protein
MNKERQLTNMKGTTQLRLAISFALCWSALCHVSAQAQATWSEADSGLPPEVVPINPTAANMSWQSGSSATAGHSAQMAAPGLVSQQATAATATAPPMQSARDFRKAMMSSLEGKGIYPQFSNPNNLNGNQLNQFGQNNMQSAAGPNLGQSGWVTPDQNYSQSPAVPAQTQTLSGGTSISSVPRQGGNSLGHGLGLVTSLGATGLTGATMRGGGGFYGLGLTGLTLLNYGAHSGFRF